MLQGEDRLGNVLFYARFQRYLYTRTHLMFQLGAWLPEKSDAEVPRGSAIGPDVGAPSASVHF